MMRFKLISGALALTLVVTLPASCIGGASDEVSPADASDDFLDERALPEDVSRDVYVVQKSAARDDDYTEFVHTILKARLDTDGHVYVKSADLLKLIESTVDVNNISLYGQVGNVLKDVVEVLLMDGVRLNIVLLVKEELNVEDGVETVSALVHAKKSRINIVTMETGPYVHTSRQKRQTSGRPSVYQQIATASGGMVITTTKNNILAVSNLLKQAVKSNHVDIMRFQWPGSKAGQHFQIPVDNTMTQMTLQIQTPSARPMAMLSQPNGIPVPPYAGQLLGSSLELYEFYMTKVSDPGQWKVVKIGRSDWDVEVTGQSPVGFTYQFMEPGAGGLGMYPLKGRPIAGKTYQFVAHVPNYARIKSVNLLLPLGSYNMPVGMPTMIHSVGGRRGKQTFTANFTMPPQDFKVAIDGMDKSNNQVRRQAPLMVFPISVDLFVPPKLGVLYTNENLTIPFTVVNTASKIQDVLIRIEDRTGFTQSPVMLFYTLKGGENTTKYFEILAGSLAGVTDTVVITAKPYIRGVVTKGQYVIRRFTVQERPAATIPTTTSTVTQPKAATQTTKSKPVPTTNSTTPVPTTQSTTPVPTTQSTTPVPTTQSTTPVPTTQSTTQVPTTQSTTPVPTTQSTTPVPTTQSTTTAPSTQTTTPISRTQSTATNPLPRPTTAKLNTQSTIIPPTVNLGTSGPGSKLPGPVAPAGSKTVHKGPVDPAHFIQDLKGLHGYLHMVQHYLDTEIEVKLDK